MHKPGLMHPTVYNKALSPSVRIKLRPFQPVYRNRLWLQLYHTQLHQTAGTENSPLLKTVLLQIVFVILSYWPATCVITCRAGVQSRSQIPILLKRERVSGCVAQPFWRISSRAHYREIPPYRAPIYIYIQVLYKYTMAGMVRYVTMV